MNRTERALKRARLTEAEALLEADETSARAEAIILTVLEEFVGKSPDAEDSDFFRNTVPEAIDKRLRDETLPEWANAIENYLQSPKPAAFPGLKIIEIVVGRTAGTLCGRELSEPNANFVRHLTQVIHCDSSALAGAMEASLTQSASATEDLVKFLRQRADRNDQRQIAFVDSRRFSRQPPGLVEHPRIQDVWDGRMRREIVFLYDRPYYEVLRRLDADAYLALLEAHPQADGIYDLLEAADLDASVHELVVLLSRAEPVFDETGSWLKKTRASFILLDLLGERLLQEEWVEGQPSTTLAG